MCSLWSMKCHSRQVQKVDGHGDESDCAKGPKRLSSTLRVIALKWLSSPRLNRRPRNPKGAGGGLRFLRHFQPLLFSPLIWHGSSSILAVTGWEKARRTSSFSSLIYRSVSRGYSWITAVTPAQTNPYRRKRANIDVKSCAETVASSAIAMIPRRPNSPPKSAPTMPPRASRAPPARPLRGHSPYGDQV